MTKLRTFAHQSEAHLAKSLLASHGIRSEILGAKEYTSHVLGGDIGNYTLVVNEDDLPAARKIIDEVMAQDMILAKPAQRTNHFKKAVVFGLLAPVIIPVVFNYFSLYHAWKYWENSRQETKDMFKVGFVLAINLLTFFLLKAMFSVAGDLMSSIFGTAEGGEGL